MGHLSYPFEKLDFFSAWIIDNLTYSFKVESKDKYKSAQKLEVPFSQVQCLFHKFNVLVNV